MATRGKAPLVTVQRGVVEVPAKALVPLVGNLKDFLVPYLPLFGLKERQVNATRAVQGFLSNIPRKSAEPIAEFHGVPRRAMQKFVGAGPWDDAFIVDRLNEEVSDVLGEDEGVLIVDPSGFPKKGEHSVGVARQWCGRLGKVENCQVGVFLSYASSKGHTLIDERLYLPEDWANDEDRRAECYVPGSVVFRTSWELALELIGDRASAMPHSWVAGDDEFGRVGEFRDRLTARSERYMLDIPSDTHGQIIGQKPHAGRRPNPVCVSTWMKSLKRRDWDAFTVRDGTKGPLQVQATWTRIVTNRRPDKKKGDWSRDEILVVVRTAGQKPETKYCLTNAEPGTPFEDLVKAACTRSRVEDCIERAKGEVGLAQYEVRSWTGWHHHMTLGLLSLWFLVKEHHRLRRLFPPLHGSASPLLRGRASPGSAPGHPHTRRENQQAAHAS